MNEVQDRARKTPLEFRLRFAAFALIYVIGFLAPWNWALHLDGRGPNAHTWGLLAVQLTKLGALPINSAFHALLAVAIVCAFAGAWLRTWGSAYLGADAMLDSNLRGESGIADGPYRCLRNPLYLGTFLITLAMAMLMPATGALFTVVAVVLFLARLIAVEEKFLRLRLGAAYAEYSARVPRIFPALRPRIPAGGQRPHWLQAVLAEIFGWGVAVSFAAVGWKYNAVLLTQCVLVSAGVALVLRAFPTRDSHRG